MQPNRRLALQISGLGLAGLALPEAAAAAAAKGMSKTALGIAPDRSSVTAIVVRTDATGNSVAETITFPATAKDFFGVTGGLKEYFRFGASRVDLFSAPPNIELPVHAIAPNAAGELFYTIVGNSQLILLDGTVIENGPGTLIMFEDNGSKGRRGRTGPHGYVAMHVSYERAK